jgi:hypothetical protein
MAAVRREIVAILEFRLYWRDISRENVMMQLVDLILLACSLANANACHEYHVLFQSAGPLEACTIRAQPYLAQWVGEHPNYRVTRWRCAWPDQEDQKS